MVDFEKFPGTQRKGAAIDSSIEDMALWDERERIAKWLYNNSARCLAPWDNGPPWDTLSERDRKPWREMAYAEMQSPDNQPRNKDTK